MTTNMLSDKHIENNDAAGQVARAVRTTGFYTYAEEAKLLRKIDLRLMPLLILLHLFKNLDNNNIGFVAVMNKGTDSNILQELGFSRDQWAWNATVFYIPYIIFQFPSTLLFKVSTPRLHQCRMAFLWGTVTACQAAVTNKAGLLSLRFLLGAFEAGMYPGMLAQIVFWYRPDEVSVRFAIFGVLEALSSILTALIVYGLQFADGKGNLSGWQWVFLLEGLVTIICSIAFGLWQPNYPDDSHWLTEEEKAFLIARLPPGSPKTTDKKFVLSDVWGSLKKPITTYLMLIKMFQSLGSAGPNFWTPSLLSNLGFTAPKESPLITMPPLLLAVISGIFFSYLVDNTRISTPVLVTGSLTISIGCFIVLSIISNRGVIYGFVNLSIASLSANMAPVTAWMTLSLHGTTEVGFAFALADSLVQLGALTAPHMFQEKYAPLFSKPLIACIVFLFVALALSVVAWSADKDEIHHVLNEKRGKLQENRKNCHMKPIYKDE